MSLLMLFRKADNVERLKNRIKKKRNQAENVSCHHCHCDYQQRNGSQKANNTKKVTSAFLMVTTGTFLTRLVSI